MRRKRKISSLLLTCIMIAAVCLLSGISVYAAEETKDGLSVEIVSDKDTYKADDEIKLDFKVTNTKEEEVNNVKLSAVLPEVLDTTDEKTADADVLKAGEALELHVTAKMKPAAEDTTSATKPINTVTNNSTNNGTTTTTTTGTSAAAIQTGQSGLLFIICLMVMLAALAAVWFFKTHKHMQHQSSLKRIISLVLCTSLLTGTLLSTGLPVFAEETTVSTQAFTDSKEIEVGGSKLTVSAKVEYDKTGETPDEDITKISDDMYITNPQPEHVRYDEAEGIPYIDNEILITFKQGVNEAAVEAFVSSFGGTIIGKMAPTNTYQIQVPVCEQFADAESLITQIEASEIVDFASPDILLIENTDAYYPYNDSKWKDEWSTFPKGNNWGVEAIKAPEAWEYVDYMQDINVGVIDNQFLNHSDLHFEDILVSSTNKIKDGDHGTHVAGIIGAGFDNGVGISGIAPKAKLFGCGNTRIEELVVGNTFSRYTAENGWENYDINLVSREELMLTFLIVQCHCRVINRSLGNSNIAFAAKENNELAFNYLNIWSDLLEPYLLLLIDNYPDFNIISSAGNESGYYYLKDSDTNKGVDGWRKVDGFEFGGKKEKIPAKFASIYNYMKNPRIKDRIIVVGAVENKTKDTIEAYSLCDFSNIGVRVDVVAPGMDIESTVNNNGYAKKSGTSQAAPHVTGIAAMLYSLNPDIKADEVKRIICETADRDVDGYKLVNAEAAVKRVMGTGNISGKVVSAKDGSDLSDVKITAYQQLKSGSRTTEFYTSSQGGFSEELISGKYELVFEKDGYQPSTIGLTIDKDVITILQDPIELQPKSTNHSDWKTQYIDYINSHYTEHSQYQEPQYALIKLDNDNTPELLIRYGYLFQPRKEVRNTNELLWMNNNQLKNESTLLEAYNEKQGTFWSWMVYSGTHFYSYSFNTSGITRMHYTLNALGYHVDGNEVDEATYNAAVDEIKAQGNQAPAYVAKDDIIQQINQY